MNLKEFKRPSSISPESETVSQAVAEYTRQLSPNPMLIGRHLKDVVIDLTAQIPHGLGVEWKGYQITNKNAPCSIYTTNKTNRQLTLNLASTATVTVDIWVF